MTVCGLDGVRYDILQNALENRVDQNTGKPLNISRYSIDSTLRAL